MIKMKSNRRPNMRNNHKNNDNYQSISNFVEKRTQRVDGDAVEIVDDDDSHAQDMPYQYEFKDETVSKPLRRRKKQIVIEEQNEDKNKADDMQGLEDIDELEKEQMKEALRQSRLQMEQDAKRREIYKIFQNTNFGAGVEIPSSSGAMTDVPSSPVSSSTDLLRHQRAESPDLFGTPQPSYEHNKPCAETSNDSAFNKARTPFRKDISIKLSPIKAYTFKTSDDSLETTSEHHKAKIEINSPEINDENECNLKVKRPHNLKKRKHMIDRSGDEDFDGAKENVQKPVTAESKKKQKTLDEDFVSGTKNEKKKRERESEKEQFVIYDDDESQDNSESEKRPNSVKKHKRHYRVVLQRTYKKPKVAIKTIKDAMKSRLHFAPPGIDHKLYTYAIIRLLDHSKKYIVKAQQKGTKFVEWGLPVVAGSRAGDTLDAKRDRKGHVIKESHTVTCTTPEHKTRRSLRSTVSRTTTNNENTTRTELKLNETVEVKKEKDSTPADDFESNTRNLGYVDSDSDEELNKPAFNYMQNNPKNWNEYNSKSKTFMFGENVDTSSTVHNKQVKKNDKVSGEKLSKQYASSISKDRMKENEQTSQENKNITMFGKSSVQKEQNNDVTKQFENTNNENQTLSEKDSNVKKISKNSENLDPVDICFTENIYKTTSKAAAANENIQTSKTEWVKTRNISDLDSEIHPTNANKVSPKHSTRNDVPLKNQNFNSDSIGSSTGEVKSPPKAHSHSIPLIEGEGIVSIFKVLSKGKESTVRSPRKFAETKATSNADFDSDTIDSSAEIGKAKRRRLSHKTPVIRDQDVEKERGCGGEDEGADIELVNIHDSTPTASNATKPGASLSNATSKSGFLKIKRDDPKVQKRAITKASHRAAEAAEKRISTGTLARDDNPTNEEMTTDDSKVECPLCFASFPLKDIQTHAATCNGTLPEPNQTDSISRRGMSTQQRNMFNDARPQTSPEYSLRNLQVVVTRSPVAERKLTEQTDGTSCKARRNLSLAKKGKAAEKRTAEMVDMTSDDDDDDDDNKIASMDQDNDSQRRDSLQGHSATWLASESQEMRKKEKYKITYGGKKIIDTRRNPFSTHEFIALEDKQPSSDSDSEASSGLNKKRLIKEMKTTPITPSVRGNIPFDDPIDIDSGSDSDNEKKTNNFKTRNINDILGPKKQGFISKKEKKKPIDDFDEGDLANERALMELAGISENSPSPDRVPLRKRRSCHRIDQSKSAKRRRKRATISSDDSDDDCQLCYVCDQRILKDVYNKHTEECIADKNARDDYATSSSTRNNKPTGRPSSSNTIEMDSDEIGDSPIKTFKLIGQEDNSTVDFDNQFSFFNDKTGSNRGSRGSRGRGRGRGKPRFKKFWRKKKRGG